MQESLRKEQEHYAKTLELQHYLKNIETAVENQRLNEMAKKNFSRTEFSPKEEHIFVQIDNIRSETETYLEEQCQSELALYPPTDSLTFKEQLENATKRAEINERFCTYYPENPLYQVKRDELTATVEKNRQEAEGLQMYADMEAEFEKIRIKIASPEKMMELNGFQKKYNKEEYPNADLFFERVANEIKSTCEIILDSLNEEMANIQDDGSDSLEERIHDSEKRIEKYEQFKKNYGETPMVAEVEGKIVEENKLNENLENWIKFEDEYKRVKGICISQEKNAQEKINACEDFISIYRKPQYEAYGAYDDYFKAVGEWQVKYEVEVGIQNLCQEFDELEKNVKASPKSYEANQKKITDLLNKFKTVAETEIPEFRLDKEKLENLQKENQQRWYEDIEHDYQHLDTSFGVKSLVDRIEVYLQQSIDYKRDELGKIMNFLNGILNLKTITVSLKGYDVDDTGFNNYITENELRFNFVGNNASINYTGKQKETDIQGASTNVRGTNLTDLRVSLTNISHRNPVTQSDSIDLFEMGLHGRNVCTLEFEYEPDDEKKATAVFAISGLPAKP